MVDVLIAGAGIVGSWLALQLARLDLQVVVCEATSQGRDGITGRNSGVLHAGIYYPADSLKARLCAHGRDLTAEFASQFKIPHRICGKLVVAGQSSTGDLQARQMAQASLEALLELGRVNGARDLELLPNPGSHYAHVLGTLALHSPHTGVIDVPAYHAEVLRQAQQAGAIFLMRRQVVELSADRALVAATDEQGVRIPDGPIEEIAFARMINATGLYCTRLAQLAGLLDYEIRPVRGEYYRLARRLPIDKLVYPLPRPDSTALGVHYTFQPDGEAYAGPNAVPANNFTDYQIQMGAAEFYESLSEITDYYELRDLSPGYSGLRPRLYYQNQSLRDFKIMEHAGSQLHLLGIESPGLTCAPALAEWIVQRYF